jgi:Tol biopolymer transport system component
MQRAVLPVLFAVAACCPCPAAESSGITLTGGPSHDGRYFSFTDPVGGNLLIRQTDTGAVHPVTSKDGGSKEFAYFSAISPDSTQVAYAWFNEEEFYDLRVVNLDGSNTRVLYRNEQAGFVQPCAWTPDGKQILTLFFRKDNISQIALVPVGGGPPKILRSLNWVYPKRMDISPDGRFVVYDSFSDGEGGDRTIFLLAVDGAKETKLIDAPGNHLFPLWMPDGKSVVLITGENVMKLRIEDGRPVGEPEVLVRNVGRILPMGITHDGSYYYGVRSGEVDVFVTDFLNPAKNAKRATIRFPGRNTAPAWSPGGNSLAYLSRRGTENFGQESRTIVVRSLGPDEEREIATRLAHIERVRWSPDGLSLLVSGSDSKGRGGLFSVDAETGALRPLVVEAGASFRGFEGAWSRDGKSLFYIHGDSELRLDDKVLLSAKGLRHITVSPDGRSLAVYDGKDIVILGIDGQLTRRVPMTGVTELEWGTRLVAGTATDLWEISPESAPRRLESPGNRQPGFSLHPDGKRIALTAGRISSDVRVVKLNEQ